MPSWDQMLGALRSRLGFGAASTNLPDSGAAWTNHPDSGAGAESATASVAGWRDVPPLQRTLEEPIAPVAINDGFRDHLAAFADPRFLAPLSHHVDPSVGGLVAGLVAPREPTTHEGPELVVPHRTGAGPAPRVQRLATWSSPAPHLSTVPLEFPLASSPPPAPEVPAEADEPVPAAPVEARVAAQEAFAEPSLPTPTVRDEASQPDGPGVPTVVPEPPAFPPDVPALPVPAAAGRSSGGTSASVQRVSSPTGSGERPPAGPVGGLPLAPESSGQSTAPERPAVAVAADPGAEGGQAPSGSGQKPEPTVQRSDADRPLAELDLVRPEPVLVDPSAVLELPLARPDAAAAGTSPPAGRGSMQLQRSKAADDVPTLGPRLAAAASAAVREPLLTPRPDEVPVQRVTYLRDELGREPSAEPPSSAHPNRAVRPDATDGVGRPGAAGLPAIQRLRELPTVTPSGSATAAGRSVPLTPTSPPAGVPGRQSAGSDPSLGAPDSAGNGVGLSGDASVSRLVDPDEPAALAESPGFTEVALPVLGGFGPAEAVAWSEPEPVEAGQTTSASAGAWSPAPVGAEPLGPAMELETWTTPTPAQSEPAAAQRRSPQVASPIAAVQRRAVPAPDAVRPVAPTVQREVSATIRTVPQPPLIVAPRAQSRPDSDLGPRPGEGMSFERMFAGVAGTASGASPDTPDDLVSVQREPTEGGSAVAVDAAGAPPAAPAAPAVSAAPGPEGASSANLDELARRLYEPLAARLREELWLDRERAGLMSDV